jgi:hypothetical protein
MSRGWQNEIIINIPLFDNNTHTLTRIESKLLKISSFFFNTLKKKKIKVGGYGTNMGWPMLEMSLVPRA